MLSDRRTPQQSPKQLHIPAGFWAVAGWVTKPAFWASLTISVASFRGFPGSNLAPHVVVQVVLRHGSEHEAGLQGLATALIRQALPLSADAVCHHDEAPTVQDLARVLVGGHVVRDVNGLLDRDGS